MLSTRQLIAAATAASAASLLACSTTSTIRYRDGLEDEVNITSSDADTIYVRRGRDEVPVPRDEIASIDYPGNASGTTGLLLTLYGVPNGLLGFEACGEQFFCHLGAWAPLVVGLPLAIEGFQRWSAATERGAGNGAPRIGNPRPSGRKPLAPPRPPTKLVPERIPIACHPLIQSDLSSLVSHANGEPSEECLLINGATSRLISEGELFRVRGFHGKVDAARIVVRDATGTEWSTPCACLLPR